MREPIKLYKIKWMENIRPIGMCESTRFVMADNVEQIAKTYPTLTFLEEAGLVLDLRTT